MTIYAVVLLLLIYKLMFFLIAQPVGQRIWTQALLRSPAGHLTNNNMREVFGTPGIWAALFLVGLGLALWTLFEISILLTGARRAVRREPGQRESGVGLGLRNIRRINILQTLRLLGREMAGVLGESLDGIRPVFRLENVLLLPFTLLVFPFTNLLMLSRFTSRFVSLKYVFQHMMSSRVLTGLFWLVLLLLIFWIVEWLFVFHFFILEQCSLVESVRRSKELIRGHQFYVLGRVAWRRFGAGAEMYLAGFLGAVAAYGVTWLIHGGLAGEPWPAQLSFRYVYLTPFVFLYTCVMTLVHYDSLTLLYHDLRRLERKKRWRFGWEGRVLAGGMAAVIMVCSLFAAAMLAHTSLVDDFVQSLTQITAHRGYSALAPENTLPAFRLAIESGAADYVELDVRETADGVLVVTHDATLKRCAGRPEKVAQLTFEEISMLDVSKDYRGPGAAEFSGVRIPTLEEVLELCKGQIGLNIEIKEAGERVTDQVIALVKQYEMEEDCVISSSRYSVLQRVKEVEPDLPCGYILSVGAGGYYDLPAADFFSMEADFVTREIVNELHLRGKEIHVWTVNQTGILENMLQLGVDNIITDDPKLIADYMEDSFGSVDDALLFVYDPDAGEDQEQEK